MADRAAYVIASLPSVVKAMPPVAYGGSVELRPGGARVVDAETAAVRGVVLEQGDAGVRAVWPGEGGAARLRDDRVADAPVDGFVASQLYSLVPEWLAL